MLVPELSRPLMKFPQGKLSFRLLGAALTLGAPVYSHVCLERSTWEWGRDAPGQSGEEPGKTVPGVSKTPRSQG